MSLRLAALAGALLLLAAVPTGRLWITSLPPAADVWVDGTYVGHSPVLVDALAPGRHTVGFSRTGWTGQEIDATIAAGQTSTASVALDRAPGIERPAAGLLAVHAAGARSVTIDGAHVDPAKGPVAAAAGSHRIVVETSRGRTTREVTVYPDVRTDVVLREDEPVRSVVVAPAADYLEAAEVHVEGDRVAIRHGAHAATARVGSTSYRLDGRNVSYDAAPTLIGGRLYLPIEFLGALTAGDREK